MTAVVRWSGREARALREARRMSVRAFAAHLGVAVASVTNWEKRGQLIRLRGETQEILDADLSRASDDVRARFQAALAAVPASSTTLAAAISTGTPNVDGVERDRADGDDGDAAEELRERLRTAAAVDAQAIALLAGQADNIRQVDRMLGARAAEAQVQGHLAALDQLRAFTVLPSQRAQLADLYADAAALAGWQCLDLGELQASWRYHEAARTAGREGRSTAALAHAVAQQAYVLAEIGDIAKAVQLAEHAGAVAGSAAPPLLRSWLWAVQGEMAASSREATACRRAFHAAERLLPDEADDPELPYVVLSDVHLTRWRGSALARLGDAAAIGELRRALNELDASFTRARAALHVDLAWALVAAERRAEAKMELVEAKRLATRVGSARQRRRIGQLESILETA